MKRSIWILPASLGLLSVCACDGDSGQVMRPPDCDEAFSSIDDFGVSAWSGCEGLFDYTAQEVLDTVLGTRQGSYPGGALFDAFDFTIEVSVTDEILGSDKALRFYLPAYTDECSDSAWQGCAASGVDFHVEVAFSTSETEQLPATITIEPEDAYLLSVEGAALRDGSGFPGSLDGIPVVHFKWNDLETESDFDSLGIAFLPGGDLFFYFVKADEEDEWVEATVLPA